MKRRALGAAFVAALISALTGSLAWADKPSSPPGQAAKEQTTVTASASASAAAENKGQAKKADDSSAATSSSAKADDNASAKSDDHGQGNGPSANASSTAQANAQSNTTSTSSPSNDSQTKTTPGGDNFDGCTGTPNTSGSPGVKPSSDTDKWTCAKAVASTAGAAADQTKRYGNGSTAS